MEESTMKAVYINSWGGPDLVQVEDREIPKIQNDNDVLVAVGAAGVNPIDWKICEGYFAEQMKYTLPMPMGWDFSGTIVATGKTVSRFKVGDQVFGFIRFPAPAGTFAEYVTAPASEIAHKPSSYDHVQAAGTPLVALTAWQALFDVAHLQSDQTVLIHAAGGGVGQFAVQLARWKGAEVIAVASKATQDLLTSFGADIFIDYTKEKFEDTVQGVDLVFNLVGDKETAMRSLSVMKAGGKIISFLGPHAQEVVDAAKRKGIEALSMMVKPNGSNLQEIATLIDEGILKTTIEKEFPLIEVKKALNLVQTGHCHGKVVLEMEE